MIDPLTILIISASLALLFFTAAKHKLRAPGQFSAQLADYKLIPPGILPGVARLVPIAEMAVFFLILMPLTRPWAAVLAGGLLVSYTIAIAINLFRGRDEIDCGCGSHPQNLSYWLLFRNSALIISSYLLVTPSTNRALVWVDFLLLSLMISLLSCVYLLIDQLVRNQGFSKKGRINDG